MPVSLEVVASEPQDGPPDEGALEAQEEIRDEAPQATEPPEVDTPEIPSIATGEESVQEPATPAPKRRGRPPKEVQEPVTPKRRGRPPKAQAPVAKAKPAAKRVAKRVAPPPPLDSESSDNSSDSPTASLHRDDIETMLLSYLVQRKNTQMDKRRQMWTQLAGLS